MYLLTTNPMSCSRGFAAQKKPAKLDLLHGWLEGLQKSTCVDALEVPPKQAQRKLFTFPYADQTSAMQLLVH